MTYPELVEILAHPENSKVAFKKDTDRPERIAKEIVAFANLRGGRIFFGIDDTTRQIVGLTRENFEEWLMDTVFGRFITPFLIPVYQELNTPKGRVGILTVEQGTQKPYFVKEADRHTPYIRIGSTSRIAEGDLLLRMAQEAGHYHFEIAPVSGTKPTDIDPELFQSFYQKEFGENLSGLFQTESHAYTEKLRQLDVLVENAFGGLSCSIAGLVLFGSNPGRYLPQHGFRIIHYKGKEVETDHHFDTTLTHPMAHIVWQNQVARSGLVELTLNKLAEVLARETLPDGIHRERVWQIPQRVLRELVVNALIHRDYTKKGRNEIRIFQDRVEFESQGRLPNTLTVEKIKAGQKYPRNPILVQFAQYFGLMEHKGLGIRKIVLAEMKAAGLPEPALKETEETLTVTVWFA